MVERELVGGECSYWACIPSKSLLRPGEAVQGARDGGASAQVDVAAALAWRDFMVSNYSDAGQERWLADHGIDLLRGTGRLAGTGRGRGRRRPAHRRARRRGDRRRPDRATGPGLRELDGVWGTREATSMKAVPRRLLVLGGGSAGVELAQVVRRLGGEAVIVEGADRVLAREPAPLGEALGEALRRDGIELVLGVHAAAARRDGEEYVLEFDDGSRAARRSAARGHRPPPAGARASAWRPSAIEAEPEGHPGRRVPARGRAAVGDRRRDRHLAADARRRVRGRRGRREHRAANSTPANYEAVPRVTYTDPQAAAVGATEAKYSATALVSEVPKTATYTHAYADSNGFLTLLSDGERLTGAYALGPEAGEWMQQATLAIRARVPLDVLADTIQPFPSFSRSTTRAVKALLHAILRICRSRFARWTRR